MTPANIRKSYLNLNVDPNITYQRNKINYKNISCMQHKNMINEEILQCGITRQKYVAISITFWPYKFNQMHPKN